MNFFLKFPSVHEAIYVCFILLCAVIGIANQTNKTNSLHLVHFCIDLSIITICAEIQSIKPFCYRKIHSRLFHYIKLYTSEQIQNDDKPKRPCDSKRVYFYNVNNSWFLKTLTFNTL